MTILTRAVAALRELLHQAAGSKVVSNVGLAIAGVGAVCAQLGDDWIRGHLGTHVALVCGWVIFAGALLAYFGRGGAAQNRRRTDAGVDPAPSSEAADAGPAPG